MPLFSYRAYDRKGKETSGQVEADSPSEAREILLKKGEFPFQIKESHRPETREKVRVLKGLLSGRRDLPLITRQLATLTAAGVPLARALESMARQTPEGTTKNLLYAVLEDVRGGMSLAESLSRYPDIFPPYYVSIVGAGEESGTLGASLTILADYLEDQEKVREKITTALAYPTLMFIIALSVVIFIMTFILPKITGIFENVGAELPLSTRILLAVSALLQRFWFFFLLLFVFLLWGYQKFSTTERGRELIDSLKLRIPLAGRLAHLIALSRFTSTTSTLLKSGLSMSRTLSIAAGTTGNVVIGGEVRRALERVIEGESLSKALQGEPHFPPTILQMIAVGEESGTLPFMLEKASASLTREYETLMARFLSLLEPVIILFMGGVVGFIVVSVMLPLLNISQIIR
ncbi:MAG: hypothetical protein D6713_07405 [Deltaproteobacteria bacterium]|nr:MAG: hypothetical protein D6713_07405 [Deltaproteobacteria bacterium]